MNSSRPGGAPRWRELALGGARAANWPNLITAARTAAAIALGFIALVQASAALLIAAYATYWLGDIADGKVARWLRQETRLGAVFDILSDRACSAICIGALLVIRPELAPALGVYFFQFMVVDALLTMGFLHWPDLVSPNYFHRVDRKIWLLNWSQPAKALNTGLLLVLLLALPLARLPHWIAVGVAIAQLAVKAWSARRMLALVTREAGPEPGRPGADAAGPAPPRP